MRGLPGEGSCGHGDHDEVARPCRPLGRVCQVGTDSTDRTWHAAQSGRPRPSHLWGSAPPNAQPAVDQDVGDYDKEGEYPLNIPGQARRVDHRQQIVLDEAVPVAGLPGHQAQVVLEVGQRTDSAGHLDERTPGGRRQVNQGRPSPSGGENAPENHEQDEAEVSDEYGVSR